MYQTGTNTIFTTTNDIKKHTQRLAKKSERILNMWTQNESEKHHIHLHQHTREQKQLVCFQWTARENDL